jgi:hypothetical protein
MTEDPFRIPTDADIAEAERALKFRFPVQYVQFLKEGSNVENAVLDVALIVRGCSYLDIFEIAETAWSHAGVPRDWLPFIENNGDYFLISESGAVRYWSHNGHIDESWPTFFAWFQQVCIECR